jgi:hypothetical protein
VKDAAVQESEAPPSIANGIHHLDRSENVDAIIVGCGVGERFEPSGVQYRVDRRSEIHREHADHDRHRSY